MDGRRSVQDLWAMAGRQLGEDAPTQDEVIQLLGQLHGADLLMTDVPPDALELFDRGERESSAKRRRSWSNPMALRLPLWDPGAFLDRHSTLWPKLWGRAAATVWLLALLPALILLPSQWAELTGNLSDRVLQADNLLLIGVVFPLIKFFHEMGHATANHAAGGEVHDMGVMLLVLMPVPYVDASSANVLRSRWARARIGAAGMLVELFIAALAFYAWMVIEPGLLRAVCFNVMLVAGVSTLIFNGNPLLRYDAYYILADLVELPNLAARSAAYWGFLIKRYLLRLPDQTSPADGRSERLWFAFYGLASAIYRSIVTLGIALFVGSRFFFFGVVLALWAVAMMALMPLVKAVKALNAVPAAQERRVRVYGILAATVAVVVGLVGFVPAPFRTQAEGVVWLPEQSVVRAAAPGFFRLYVAAPGSKVDVGQTLARSVDPALDVQVRVLQAKVEELEASYAAEFVADRPRAAIVGDQLEHERASLERAVDRVRGLEVAARSAGSFTVQQAADMPGRHLKQGSVIGYVVGDDPPVVRVVLDQASVEPVTLHTRTVELRLAGALEIPLPGKIIRQVPAGKGELSSPALSAAGGGRIPIDPRDPEGRRTLERVFELDVGFSVPIANLPFGQRVHVRFDHPPEPIAAQTWRALRRLFLRHFDV